MPTEEGIRYVLGCISGYELDNAINSLTKAGRKRLANKISKANDLLWEVIGVLEQENKDYNLETGDEQEFKVV